MWQYRISFPLSKESLYFKDVFTFILSVFCLCADVSTCVPGAYRGQKRALGTPRTGVAEGCAPPYMLLQGVKSRSSARAASTLHC